MPLPGKVPFDGMILKIFFNQDISYQWQPILPENTHVIQEPSYNMSS